MATPKVLEILDQLLRLLKQRVKQGKGWIFRDGLMNSVGFSKSSHQHETFLGLTRRTLDVDGGPDG